jgi:HEAT repeat protein/lysophospholipase L1-like esterase
MNWRIAGNLALSAGVTALCVGLAEGWARWTEIPRPPRPVADTRGLDWEAEWQGDFFVVKSASVGWPSTQDFNRDGLRDRRHPREKLPGTHRVVGLGDSVTLGYGFPREQAWPQVLGRRLAARGPGVEVFNVALIGWSTRQERYAYERIARAYRPDTVVLAICLNDVEDLQNNLHRPPRLLTALFRRSAFVRRVVDPEGREIRSIEELFETPESPRVGRGYARLFEEIRLLKAAVEEDGARLVLMLFPDADQVGTLPRQPVPQERMRAFARMERLPLVDPLPALRAIGPDAFMDRVHFTPAGSAAVAETLLDAGVVPASAWSTGALSEAPGPAVSPAPPRRLAALLAHADHTVRRQAAWAIGGNGGAAAQLTRELTAALRDNHPAVRVEAARALGAAGPLSAEARDELFIALGDGSETVRWAAADAIASLDLSDPESARRLAAALDSPDTYVRGFAAWSLAHSGPAAVVATRELVARTGDPDAGVRTLAVRALGNLGSADPDVLAALERILAQGSDEERWRAARALAKLGPAAASAVGALSRALDEDDAKLRREAALGLARIGASAEPALPRLVAARRDADPAVRDAAEKAIRRITESR